MVHTLIPMPQARRIKQAKAAVDAEWNKLIKKNAWDYKSVTPKKKLIAKAKEEGRHIHIGSLMDLCHEKHSERNLPMDQKEYKGRVVFRGDQVKDQDGHLAIFTE